MNYFDLRKTQINNMVEYHFPVVGYFLIGLLYSLGAVALCGLLGVFGASWSVNILWGMVKITCG